MPPHGAAGQRATLCSAALSFVCARSARLLSDSLHLAWRSLRKRNPFAIIFNYDKYPLRVYIIITVIIAKGERFRGYALRA